MSHIDGITLNKIILGICCISYVVLCLVTQDKESFLEVSILAILAFLGGTLISTGNFKIISMCTTRRLPFKAILVVAQVFFGAIVIPISFLQGDYLLTLSVVAVEASFAVCHLTYFKSKPQE